MLSFFKKIPLIFVSVTLFAANDFVDYFSQKIIYKLSNDPIDVIIPCSQKDQEILDLCIEGIKENGKDIRRIIVISKKPLTQKAEWFGENFFPFSKEDLAYEIFHGNIKLASDFLSNPKTRIGWIYQQFLKLYAAFIIPNISENILVLDADTIFLNPVKFINEQGEPMFSVGKEHHKEYFSHAKRLLPGFKRVFREYSGISHHMIFQRPILEDLFNIIRLNNNGKEPWKAICHHLNTNEIYGSSFSEYEIYFNFVFLRTNQGKLRHLKQKNVRTLDNLNKYKDLGFSCISCHSWQRIMK